jgi:hypothetical protein
MKDVKFNPRLDFEPDQFEITEYRFFTSFAESYPYPPIQFAWMLGAERVIAIDRVPERLLLAESWGQGRGRFSSHQRR